jgi:3-phosphoshikimate 1-carboxyvinyltransferase
VIRVQGTLVSLPYVAITLDVLRWAGIEIDAAADGSLYRIPSGQRPVPSTPSFSVGGDYSSAAFVLAAACLCDARVLVRGLRADQQGDRAILAILRDMGADLDVGADGVLVRGPARLSGIDLDCSGIPDLVPILCVLGAFAEGRTLLRGIAHLRHKESDRLQGPTVELGRLGARIAHTGDAISIEKSELRPGRVSARRDHRLAMSLMVAGLAVGGVEVSEAQTVRKSYPAFIRDLRSLGAEIG